MVPYILEELSIEGFRGINKKLALKMREGVSVLFGRNGVGKTSVLQAIEWGLTGKLPYLKGHEFAYEDAVVNLFHLGKIASVVLKLRDEKGNFVVVTRNRKMGKSTTRGKDKLQVEMGEELLRDKKAQEKLNLILGLKPEDFPRTIYLHQESIRDLLTADPEERSRTIDRLLGTFELRELADSLGVKRNVQSEINKLQKRVETLERDKIVFVVHTKEKLEQDRNRLLRIGHSEDELTVENAAQSTARLIEEVRNIAKQLETEIPSIETPEPGSESINNSLSEAEKQLKTLDRFRSTAHRKQEEKKLNLAALKAQYEQATKDLQEFGKDALKSFLGKMREIEIQLEEVRQKLDALRSRVDNLVEAKIRYQSASNQVGIYSSQIEEIRRIYGDEQDHLSAIEKLKKSLAELQNEIEKFSSLSQIIDLASEYLNESQPAECPVCGQPIEYESVVAKLRREAQASVSEKMKQLNRRKEEERKKLQEIERSLEKWKDISTRLDSEKSNLEDAKKEIKSVVGESIDPSFNIDDSIKEAKAKITEFSDLETALTYRIAEIGEKLEAFKRSSNRVEDTLSSIQKVIKSSLGSSELIEQLEKEIEATVEKAKRFEDTLIIDSISEGIRTSRDLVHYLQSKEESTELEKQLPQVTELVSHLKTRTDKLSALARSLETKREATVACQKEAVSKTLKAFEDSINHFYSTILGHPYFVKLRLVAPEEGPSAYSIMGVSADSSETTYIPTRFSNTQMNVVALSIFLSNNMKIGGDLEVVIMDDPAQSMDQEHKEALSRILQELSADRQVIIATQDLELKKATERNCRNPPVYLFNEWTTEAILTESS